MSSRLGVNIKEKTVSCIAQLKDFLKSEIPFLIVGSKTATTIGFETWRPDLVRLSLANMPKEIIYNEESQEVLVKGPITWEEVKIELARNHRNLACAPTEKSAQVLAGLATSCSGEDCFLHGHLRDQVIEIKYLDYQGNEQTLKSQSHEKIKSIEGIEKYAKTFDPYIAFKNAPFPRLKFDTDLMIGTEGQLGIILEAKFKTIAIQESSFVLIPSQSWRKDLNPLKLLYSKLKEFSKDHSGIIAGIEFFDRECIELIKSKLLRESDYVVLQVIDDQIETIQKEILKVYLQPDVLQNILVLSEKEWNQLRVEIPRRINEKLSQQGLIKKGTDIQTDEATFFFLLEKYQFLSQLDVESYLFGHLGDQHLHFNFLPRADKKNFIDEELDRLYSWCSQNICSSPFAEHGIGVIKQRFIKKFWYNEHIEVFKKLKDQFDPKRVFFPAGYMTMDEDI